MKSELTFTHDNEELPPDDAFCDQWNTIVTVNLRLDLWMMLHSSLSPEKFVDKFFEGVKEQALEHFYNRYPEKKP